MINKHFSVDIVLNKTKRWDLKELLLEKDMVYFEWFLELQEDVSIISVNLNIDEFEGLYNAILSGLSECRIILPNGVKVHTKESFDMIKAKLIK